MYVQFCSAHNALKTIKQINGYTDPSVQDLRALIVKHGGIYHPYLDSKLTMYVRAFLAFLYAD